LEVVNLARPREHNAEDLAEKLNQFIDETDDPQLAKFCLPRGMPARETLWELGKNCTSLANAITRAKAKCEIYLTGPDCKIHPKIAGIRLATNHNMVERQQIDSNVQVQNSDMTQAQIDARIKELLAKK
jgi:hypothetical protein